MCIKCKNSKCTIIQEKKKGFLENKHGFEVYYCFMAKQIPATVVKDDMVSLFMCISEELARVQSGSPHCIWNR